MILRLNCCEKSSAQIPYIRHVLESSSPTKYQYAEGLFKRSLKTSPFVDLWKYYLRYVQYVGMAILLLSHPDEDCRQMNTAPATKDTVRKAYEFALNHIGHDKESGLIWNDYVQFLKDLEVCRLLLWRVYVLSHIAGYVALGRRPEERRDTQGLSTSRADPDGKRETSLGRVARMGEWSE